jgi:hypothetical protein
MSCQIYISYNTDATEELGVVGPTTKRHTETPFGCCLLLASSTLTSTFGVKLTTGISITDRNFRVSPVHTIATSDLQLTNAPGLP